jgi:hypothetical protein
MRLMRVVLMTFVFCFLAFSDDSGGPPVIPEPSLVGLLTVGMAGIGFAAWRRNRKR